MTRELREYITQNFHVEMPEPYNRWISVISRLFFLSLHFPLFYRQLEYL